ncbi:hypothetical protein [Chryseobacterium aurantiacum]|uniref:hypothetical protein n=1 Tax=Chryseobacterium aurantiacum TaxID=2116499 RepID=UPI0013C4410F|nr:hypothetical protein [Chryseobacterium aurantiacum]
MSIKSNDRHKIRRVFYHELGHYVSAFLNKKYFTGYGSEYIKIHRCENKQDEFCGKTEPIKPKDYKKNILFYETLSENLVSYIYGCLFQSYFSQSQTLEYCFKYFGKNDEDAFYNNIAIHRLGQEKAFRLEQLNNEHYKKIADNELLKELESIDILSILIENDIKDEYFVDLKTLHEIIEGFLESYKDVYCEFIENYKDVINE